MTYLVCTVAPQMAAVALPFLIAWANHATPGSKANMSSCLAILQTARQPYTNLNVTPGRAALIGGAAPLGGRLLIAPLMPMLVFDGVALDTLYLYVM